MGIKQRLQEDLAAGGQYGGDIPMKGLASVLAVDVAIPTATYYIARTAGASMFLALLLATIAAGLRALWTIWRQREVDGFAVFILLILGLGLAASFVTGDAKFMLYKNAAATIMAGLLFFASCIIKKPLSYAVGLRMSRVDDHSHADLLRGWEESAPFRRGFYIMSAVWGGGLVIDGLVRMWAIWKFSLDTSVWLSAVIQVLFFIVLGAWNVWFVALSRKYAAKAKANDTASAHDPTETYDPTAAAAADDRPELPEVPAATPRG
jgi:hypothetical protein